MLYNRQEAPGSQEAAVFYVTSYRGRPIARSKCELHADKRNAYVFALVCFLLVYVLCLRPFHKSHFIIDCITVQQQKAISQKKMQFDCEFQLCK